MIFEQLKTYLVTSRSSLEAMEVIETLKRVLGPTFYVTLQKLREASTIDNLSNDPEAGCYALKSWLELAGLMRLELKSIAGANSACFYYKCQSGKESTSRCSGCKQVQYCSRDCQSRYSRNGS